MDVNSRIEEQLKSHDVLLYMKGTPDFPQCGFSGQTVAALNAVGKPFSYINIFEDEEIRGFWMDNTYIDLDVAFIDASLRIVGLDQLEALDKEVKDSPSPFMYAVEVPRGWFDAHGVSVGDSVAIEPPAAGGDDGR